MVIQALHIQHTFSSQATASLHSKELKPMVKYLYQPTSHLHLLLTHSKVSIMNLGKSFWTPTPILAVHIRLLPQDSSRPGVLAHGHLNCKYSQFQKAFERIQLITYSYVNVTNRTSWGAQFPTPNWQMKSLNRQCPLPRDPPSSNRAIANSYVT